MMPSEKERPDPPLGALLVLLLVVAGVAIHNVPLNSGRPKPGEIGKTAELTAHRVDARLWQDPFGAIPARQSRNGTGTTATTLASLIGHGVADCRLDVLGAMVFAGPYEELAEQRRRARFAVVSGLNAVGRYPDDPMKLGYLIPPQSSGTPAAGAANTKGAGLASQLPKVLPFELFLPDDKALAPVLVLWIDEGPLSRAPLAQLAALRSYVDEQLAPVFRKCALAQPETKANWRFVGPISSLTLRELHAESPKNGKFAVPFFSGQATWHDNSNGVCSEESAEDDKPCPTIAPHAVVVRTIADDLRVSQALVRELQLRPDVFSHPSGRSSTIALISEWDTRYGRELPKYFKQAVTSICHSDCVKPNYIETGYLRSMDGTIASGQRDDTAGVKSRDGSSEADKPRFPSAATPEQAEGNAQLDYLRRLAADLHQKHSARVAAGEPGIRAIGVLGSDVYDKLMLLRALRPLLPEAVYFTLDLDARMFDAEQAKWSRNLIVASSLGLQLRAELQHNVPPFRDSYQTATYLATIAALSPHSPEELKKRLPAWLKTPRVYEIGTTAFPLPREHPNAATGEDSACSPLRLTACKTLHATQKADRLTARGVAPIAIGLAITAGLVLMLSMKARCFVLRNRLAAGLGAVGVLSLVGMACFWFDSKILADPSQEPFTLLGGISVWPSTLIRLLALLLAVVFIFIGWRTTKRSFGEIEKDFFGGVKLRTQPAQDPVSSFDRDPRDGNSPVDTRMLWEEYRYRRDPFRAAVCIGAIVALILGLASVLIALDHRPITPCRGALSCSTAKAVVVLAVLAFLMLLGLVVRETNLCQRFIRVLYAGPSQWPTASGRPFDSAEDHQRDWRRIQLVARLTSIIGVLIYGPFLVILLLIVARSSAFDQWHLPPGLLAIFAMSLVLAAAAAFQMRRAAEHARGRAIASMTDERRRLQADSTGIARIDSLIEETKVLSTGAFRPLFQQPIVRAILLPLGGYGGVAVLEYLALFSQ